MATELWICDSKKNRKYIRFDNSWNFKETIDFDFVINKFKIISDEYILLVTGQNDESLLLTDITGVPLRKYLKNEFPFLMFKAVQFVDHDSCIIFQLGVSNEAIEFNTKYYSFENVTIATNKEFLTSKKLLDLYDRFGLDFLGEISKTNCIKSFRKINDAIWIDYYFQEEHFVAVKKNGVWKKIKVDMKNNFPTTTFGMSESNDSFILYEYPEDDKLNLILYEYLL